MAEINLLKKKTENNLWQSLTSLLVKLMALVAVGLVVYYGYLLFSLHQQTSETASLSSQYQSAEQSAVAVPDRDELYTRQQQLQQLLTLVANHPYWSNVLPALASSTLSSANYLSFQTNDDGTISLAVTVPSMDDLDNFLQVFDLPQFNQDFYNVKISSIGKSEINGTLMDRFDVTMSYNPSLLKAPASQPSS